MMRLFGSRKTNEPIARGLFIHAVLACGAKLVQVDPVSENDFTLYGPTVRTKLACAGELFLQCERFCPDRDRCPVVNQLSKADGYDHPIALGRLRVAKADGVNSNGLPMWVFDSETENAHAVIKGMIVERHDGTIILSRLKPTVESEKSSDDADDVAGHADESVGIREQ